MNNIGLRFLTLALPFIFLIAHADQVALKDGSVIVGSVDFLKEGTVTVETSFAGTIEIPWDQIQSVETAEDKPIHLDDGSVIQGTIVRQDDGSLEVVRGKGRSSFEIGVDEIVAIDPPAPPEPKPPKWKGKVVGSMTLNQGNTELLNSGITLDMSRRGRVDRYTFKAAYYYAEDESESTRDEQNLSGKYDYFFNERLYAYFNSRFDRDAIKELDLRTSAGLGAGYQLLETDIYNLFGEAGLSYVNEDYEADSDDQDYIAGRLASHFDWWIIEERLQLSNNIELLTGIQDLNDWLLIADLMLSYNWTEQWSLNGGVRLDYDNTPAVGQEREDIEYILGVGYTF